MKVTVGYGTGSEARFGIVPESDSEALLLEVLRKEGAKLSAMWDITENVLIVSVGKKEKA